MVRSTYKRGEKIMGRYRGGKKYYPGTITCVNRNGTYDVRYEDGDFEQDVKKQYIKSMDSENFVDSISSFKKSFVSKKLRIGQKVEARFNKGKKFYSGKVVATRHNNCYDIDYDDGDTEKNVSRELIRVIEESSQPCSHISSDGEIFGIGESIEARWSGKARFYPGKIKKRNSDGTYVVNYTDGDKESNVNSKLIRRKSNVVEKKSFNLESPVSTESSSSIPSNLDFHIKQIIKRLALIDVTAIREKFEGFDINATGSLSTFSFYKVLKEVGIELSVPEKKALASQFCSALNKTKISYHNFLKYLKTSRNNRSPTSNEHTKNKKFFKILKQYGTDGISISSIKKVKQIFSRKCENTIALKDFVAFLEQHLGSTWTKVQIRNLVKCFGTLNVDGFAFFEDLTVYLKEYDNSNALTSQFEEGDVVEARYKGKSKFYRGRIVKVHSFDLYDIDYDDGDNEIKVPSYLIRHIASVRKSPRHKARNSSSPLMRLQKGDKVEAQFGGGKKYFPGVITKVHADGYYDVNYADGDYEKRVESKLIHRLTKKGENSFNNDEQDLKKGDLVLLANGEGQTGKIVKIHPDNSVTVRFKNGEIQKFVDQERLEKLNVTQGTNPEFRIKERVEAKFKDSKKFYVGTVTRINNNGSIGVTFDDGDFDSHVPLENVRKIVSSKTKETRSGNSSMSVDERGTVVSTAFQVGEKIKTISANEPSHVIGKGEIIKANKNGSYLILFDNGKVKKNVPACLIKKLRQENDRFEIGQKVEVREYKSASWKQGIILKLHGKHYCDVKLICSGRVLQRLKNDLIRTIVPKGICKTSEFNFEVGQQVLSPKTNSSTHKKSYGTIKKVNKNAKTVNIEFEDGERKRAINVNLVSAIVSTSSSFSAHNEESTFTDDNVEIKEDNVVSKLENQDRQEKNPILNKNHYHNTKVLYQVGDSVLWNSKHNSRPVRSSVIKVNNNLNRYDIKTHKGETIFGCNEKVLTPIVSQVRVGDKVKFLNTKNAYAQGTISRIDALNKKALVFMDKSSQKLWVPFPKISKLAADRHHTVNGNSSSLEHKNLTGSYTRNEITDKRFMESLNKDLNQFSTLSTSSNPTISDRSFGSIKSVKNFEASFTKLYPYIKTLNKYFISHDVENTGLIKERTILKAIKKTGVVLSVNEESFLHGLRNDSGKIHYKVLLEHIKENRIIPQDEVYCEESNSISCSYTLYYEEFRKKCSSNSFLSNFLLQLRPVISCLKTRNISPHEIIEQLNMSGTSVIVLTYFPTVLKKLGFSLSKLESYHLWKALSSIEIMRLKQKKKQINSKLFSNLLLYLYENSKNDLGTQDNSLPKVPVTSISFHKHLRNQKHEDLIETPAVLKAYKVLQNTLLNAIRDKLAGSSMEVFNMFDVHNSGYITMEDFVLGLAKLKIIISEKVALLLFEYIRIKHKAQNAHLDVNAFSSFLNKTKQGSVDTSDGFNATLKNLRLRLISKFDRTELLNVFKLYDPHNLGYITIDSLKKILNKLNILMNVDKIYANFMYSNRDKFSYFDLLDFIFANENYLKNIKSFLNELFKDNLNDPVAVFTLFQERGKDYISLQKFKSVIFKARVKTTSCEINCFFRQLDLDTDGRVKLPELKFYLCSLEKELGFLAGKKHDTSFQQDEAYPCEGMNTKSNNIEDYIKHIAPKRERRNFYTLIKLLNSFEKNTLGKRVKQVKDGEITMPLGTHLKVNLRFLAKYNTNTNAQNN